MAVRRILNTLQGQASSPIIYVQRLDLELTDTLVQWLEAHTGTQVSRVRSGQALETGNVYVANHEHDVVRVVQDHAGVTLHVTGPNGDPRHLDSLMRSTADVFGPRAVGILLSGRGSDGSAGLACLRNVGGLTIAQDRASSPLYELPGRAREEGAAVECLPINEIAERVSMLMHPENAIKP
jgi:two-component system chemotaxis response regulator CheB